MSEHRGHRARTKKEFLNAGLDGFSDLRALELLLFFTRQQGDVNPAAHALLDRFGTLAGVLDADPAELQAVPGVGENSAVLLKLIPAMAARYVASRSSRGEVYTGSEWLQELLRPYFFAARSEISYIACFDAGLKLLGVRKLGEGGPNATGIYARQAAAAALSLNATAVILAHNHTSGFFEPSPEDLSTTEYLRDLLGQMDVVLYDHAIFTDSAMYSFRDGKSIPHAPL